MTSLFFVVLALAWSRTATVSTYSEASAATHAQSTAINGASAAAELSTGPGAYRPGGGVALQKDGGSFGFAGVAKLDIPDLATLRKSPETACFARPGWRRDEPALLNE